MKKTLLLSSGLWFATLTALSAGIVPGSPTLKMEFEINGDVGVVKGTLTAPSKSSQWSDLPADTKMNITVTRGCYALNESNVPVVTFTDLAPGEQVTFTDNAVPAWQYGQEYTYNPVASIGEESGYPGYGSIKPGINFSFDYDGVKVKSKENPEGGLQVEISALVPSKILYSTDDIPVEMKSLKFYRVTDLNSWPYEKELIGTIDNPTKGETYVYVDNNPQESKENRYVVICDSGFGFAETSQSVFVGYDVPDSPYPVTAVSENGGIKITWTAPDRGANYGKIKPEATYYIVSRCWGSGEDQKKVIVDNLKDTEFIDFGADMDSPLMVRYEVTAANNIGVGKSNYSDSGYKLIVGPEYTLPFTESFDNASDKLWLKEYSSYYCQFYTASEAEFGDNLTVSPPSGDGLIYVDYASSRGNASNDLTSYFINTKDARCAGLSFWYYALPSTDITIQPQISKDYAPFETLETVEISKDVTEGGWREKFIALGDLSGSENISVRFHISAPTSKMAAILDDIMILDHKSVGALEVEYLPEECKAVITWEDPSSVNAPVTGFKGYVDGVDVGEVNSPWVYEPGEYKVKHTVAVQALYDHIEAPLSAPVTISVPRPPYTEFEIDQHVFSVVNPGSNDVHEITVKKYLGDNALYKIPELVTYDDITYSVVGIDKEAYAANKSLVSVSLTDIVSEIGESAFSGCDGLMAISFGIGLKSIGSKAFKDCSSLSSVMFSGETPPSVADDAFEGIAEDCKGTCPEGTASAYSAVAGLSPIDFGLSGVDGIFDTDSDFIEYFDLGGAVLKNPVSGKPIIVRITKPDGTIISFKKVY